jgi:hypothetical protein
MRAFLNIDRAMLTQCLERQRVAASRLTSNERQMPAIASPPYQSAVAVRAVKRRRLLGVLPHPLQDGTQIGNPALPVISPASGFNSVASAPSCSGFL